MGFDKIPVKTKQQLGTATHSHTSVEGALVKAATHVTPEHLSRSSKCHCRSASLQHHDIPHNIPQDISAAVRTPSFRTANDRSIPCNRLFFPDTTACSALSTSLHSRICARRRSVDMELNHGSSVILVVSLLLAALVHSTDACVAAERTALLAFKARITADPQGLLSRWVANGDCCSWGGTFCDGSGHVTQINLASDPAFDDDTYFLKGTISPELATLTHLQRLDLASLKQLSGPLPAALGNLKSLQYFSVRTSKLTGSIPSAFGGLTSLTFLDLGANSFTGGISPALGNIGPQLLTLFLGYNKLSGAIPTTLHNLKGLQDFYLTGNKLTGSISPLVGQLKGLTNLDFSNNQLTGPLPSEIGSLNKLGFFDMSGNKLTGSIPESFGKLTKIYHFTINNNKISGQIPSSLAQNWKNLSYIDFSNNQLSGPIPQGASFSSIPASSFTGNPGLCGNPLPACK